MDVSEETRSTLAPLSHRQMWVHFLLYPAHTLPIAAAPVLVGVGLAIHNHVFLILPAFCAFGASWLIHTGGLFLNYHELLARHPDNREHPELVNARANGSLSLSTLRNAIIFCFVAAILTGPYLLHVAGPLVILFGIVGLFASWGYSAGPFIYTRFGLADPIFFAMFGIVAVVGTYYVQAAPHFPADYMGIVLQALPLHSFLVGLPIGGLVTNVMLVDDICDQVPDRAKGWRTGAVLFGVNWNRREITAFTIFAYLAPFWLWLGLGYSPWVLLPLLTLPRAWTIVKAVHAADAKVLALDSTPKGAFLALYYGALLGLGLAL